MDITSLKKGRKRDLNIDQIVYGKVPPQNTELEGAILGAMMIEPICIQLVLALIKTPDVFYKEVNKNIYRAIISLYDKSINIDLLTIVNELKKLELLDLVGGSYYVAGLTNNVSSSIHIEDHCRAILETYLSRELIKITVQAANSAYEDSTDIFDLYNITDNELIKAREIAETGASKDITHYGQNVLKQYNQTKETGVLGIKTKITEFDRIFCGLVAPDLLIIAARPGAGKTALCLSIINNICVQDKIPVAIFSLEMDGDQLTRRLASIDSCINHQEIRTGKIPSDKMEHFYNAIDRIQSAPLFIEDKCGLTIRDLRTRAHILKRKHGLGAIFVDYLQLMDGIPSKNNSTREQDISTISRGLKTLAKELKIPIIALSQLSRAVELRPDKMPQLSDLRESGAIEQDADGVLFLMRPEYYNFTEPVEISGISYDVKNLTIAKGAKNRHGSTENFALSFIGPIMKFTNREPESINNNYTGYVAAELGLGTSEDLPF